MDAQPLIMDPNNNRESSISASGVVVGMSRSITRHSRTRSCNVTPIAPPIHATDIDTHAQGLRTNGDGQMLYEVAEPHRWRPSVSSYEAANRGDTLTIW